MDAIARQKLEELRKAIDGAAPLDAEGAEFLKSLDEDIRRLLARSSGAAVRPDQASGEHAGMGERWRRGVEHFEATHPDLTASLSRALDLLAGGGL